MLKPPIAPMLAKLTRDIPVGEGWVYEPKWDGFRAIVFKDGDDVVIQSRDLKPLQRYFPEVVAALTQQLPKDIVVDGEIVIASQGALDFEALLLRIHPAATRVELLARETPASFVAWDVLSLAGNDDVMKQPLRERRALLEQAFAHVQPPIHLTPFTRDSGLARSWFERFEGAGLDGVVAKRDDGPYVPGQRVMAKVKHARTADVVVAGFRYYAKGGKPRTDAVGSLVLGLFDAAGTLHHTGVAASFTMKKREELISFLAPYRLKEGEAHPWKAWAPPPAEEGEAEAPRRRPGMTSRWNRGKDLSWQPLRLELVAEVAFDHLQGDRFRHATHFQRWRSDKKPSDCTYDQLDEVAPQELADLFAGR